MKQPHVILINLSLLLLVGASWAEPVRDQRVVYEPTWESLDAHETPQWLMDAKLGLFYYPPHPTEREWDAYWRRRTGGDPPRAYLYADGAWDRGPWDPQSLAQLAVDAGARYVVWCMDPVSFFLTHPSDYADRPDSPWTTLSSADGSARDYTGEMAAAARARGLRFGIYRNYHRPAVQQFWLETVYEAIDRYQPDTLWLDEEKLSFSAEELRSRELLAYYYNHANRPEDVACEDALGSYKAATFGQRLVHGDWYRKEAGMAPPAAGISDGYYVRYEELERGRTRSPIAPGSCQAQNLVWWTVHCASHNGNLEIALWCFPAAADPAERAILQDVGTWLKLNAEAIYGTRPWFGGRPALRTDTGAEVRFTARGNVLYAIILGAPGGEFALPGLRGESDTTVRLLGHAERDAAVTWRQDASGMRFTLGAAPNAEGPKGASVDHSPRDFACTLRINPRPQWVGADGAAP